MLTRRFSRSLNNHISPKRLADGSHVAVMGGGPAGSFFSYFLLEMAERVGIGIKVDIYEPRDFSLPAPQGCNMCAGVISETLVQDLATEGINLPASIIQKAIDSYVMHTDVGSHRIDAAFHEKRIGTIFRGGGPRGWQEAKLRGFDDYLLSLAKNKGANHIQARVTGVERAKDHLHIKTNKNAVKEYDLLAVAAGVNTITLKLFETSEPKYKPPATIKTALREYRLGKDTIEKHFGDSLHVFLIDIPKLDMAMLVPKGDFVSVSILGKEIDEGLLHDFFTAPEVKNCFPRSWHWDQPDCQCAPRINIRAAIQPYGDQIVYIGDSGATRLLKDGMGTAYRSAKAAASCAILEGISSDDFRRYYAPFCRRMEIDNNFGRIFFFVTHLIQRMGFFRKAVLRMMAVEQCSARGTPRMSDIMWDTFTGSAPYQDIFLRTLHPAFISRLAWNLAKSLLAS